MHHKKVGIISKSFQLSKHLIEISSHRTDLICFVEDDGSQEDEVEGEDSETVDQGPAAGRLPQQLQLHLLRLGVTM